MFSRDVTAAMLLSLHKGTAAMLVSPTNPSWIELYSYANVFFCFSWKTCSLITWVKTLYKPVSLTDLKKKDRIELLLFEKMTPKNFSGGHLTRTHKAGPNDESMRNHRAWIVKCKFKDFRATSGVYSTYFWLIWFIFLLAITNWVLPIRCRWLQKLGFKTKGSSSQSFLEISS